MLFYCPKCNNLIDKKDDQSLKQGELLEKKCNRCGDINRFYIKIQAVIDRKWNKCDKIDQINYI